MAGYSAESTPFKDAWTSPARVIDTVYQNTDARARFVLAWVSGASTRVSLKVENVNPPTVVVDTQGASAGGEIYSVCGVVPPGHYYKWETAVGAPALSAAREILA